MYRNERCLMKSKKASRGIAGGIILIFIILPAAFYIAVKLYENIGHAMDFKEEIIFAVVVLLVFIGIACTACSSINSHRTEVIFFEHHIEGKVCSYNSLLGFGINIHSISLKYSQIEGVSRAGMIYLILTISGRRYAVAAKNAEECMQMINEMKWRNMQVY